MLLFIFCLPFAFIYIHAHVTVCMKEEEGEEEPRLVLYTVRKGEKWPSFRSKMIFFLISSPFHLSPSHYPHPPPPHQTCSSVPLPLSFFLSSTCYLQSLSSLLLFLSFSSLFLLPISAFLFLHSYLIHKHGSFFFCLCSFFMLHIYKTCSCTAFSFLFLFFLLLSTPYYHTAPSPSLSNSSFKSPPPRFPSLPPFINLLLLSLPTYPACPALSCPALP